MILKPQDVVILLKLVALGNEDWSFSTLSTALYMSPLSQMLVSSSDPPPVWPDPEGNVRGQSFSPLYKSAPKAAGQDHQLYELLVLTDAIRDWERWLRRWLL